MVEHSKGDSIMAGLNSEADFRPERGGAMDFN